MKTTWIFDLLPSASNCLYMLGHNVTKMMMAMMMMMMTMIMMMMMMILFMMMIKEQNLNKCMNTFKFNQYSILWLKAQHTNLREYIFMCGSVLLVLKHWWNILNIYTVVPYTHPTNINTKTVKHNKTTMYFHCFILNSYFKPPN